MSIVRYRANQTSSGRSEMFYISPLTELDCSIKRLAINIASLTGLDVLIFCAKPIKIAGWRKAEAG
jgi:hypothetical protein